MKAIFLDSSKKLKMASYAMSGFYKKIKRQLIANNCSVCIFSPMEIFIYFFRIVVARKLIILWHFSKFYILWVSFAASAIVQPL